ncbi:MAG: Uma2 family endonuclease [Gammaproteobacteria bacterium]|nr:Uma2 family endonuclease [Gammaproteobacteria bacterium]
MIEAGIFMEDDHVELLDGEIIDMTPQKSLHATAISLVDAAIRKVIATEEYYVRIQLPLALDDLSQPEPDITVVRGGPRDYRDAHPTTAVLVVEVSDATLSYDRGKKLEAYARSSIPEYWVLNLKDGSLEVYREPQGIAYHAQTSVGALESVQPLVFPEENVRVQDLLP